MIRVIEIKVQTNQELEDCLNDLNYSCIISVEEIGQCRYRVIYKTAF